MMADRGGYACPQCGNRTGVFDSRLMALGIRRRRKCGTCDHRFTTYETERRPNSMPDIAGALRALAELVDEERK